MSNTTKPPRTDFWPEDIRLDVLSPTMILKEQAESLTRRTQGILRGEAVSHGDESVNVFHLDVYATALGQRVRFLTLRHKQEEPYPVAMTSFAVNPSPMVDPSELHLLKLLRIDELQVQHTFLEWSQIDFEDRLKKLVTSDYIRSKLQSLIARSNEVKKEAPKSATGSAEAVAP